MINPGGNRRNLFVIYHRSFVILEIADFAETMEMRFSVGTAGVARRGADSPIVRPGPDMVDLLAHCL